MKEALGMMMDVRTREANGVRYMGMLPKPKTLKLALPLTARIVIHLPMHTLHIQPCSILHSPALLHALDNLVTQVNRPDQTQGQGH